MGLDLYGIEEHKLIHEVHLSINNKVLYKQYFQILHPLGLLHEHQRPDRDQYIDIDFAAIRADPTMFNQLKKDCFLNLNFRS